MGRPDPAKGVTFGHEGAELVKPPGGLRTVALIPARGGSKRLPGKNLRVVAGKPLIAHTIEQALGSACIDRTYVSTDSPEIALVASEFGAEVIPRPPALSGDEASSESALEHGLEYLRDVRGEEYDIIVFLQCTCPVRRPSDIDSAVGKLVAEDADSLLSVVQSRLFTWAIQDGRPVSTSYDYTCRNRTQDMAPTYVENGSIYVLRPSVFMEQKNRLGGRISLFEMDRHSLIDIDEDVDIDVCRAILEARR